MKRKYLPKEIRKVLSILMAGLEKLAGSAFDRIVVVTPVIGKRFPRNKTVLVQNFPIKDELATIDGRPYEKRPFEFAYVGGITRVRSAVEMVQALNRLDYDGEVKLHMAGSFRPAGLEVEVEKTTGWESVIFHGWAGRDKIAEILGRSRAGLVLCYPAPNFVNSQPVKLFEYMSAGLPVIVSDFPLWRRIIEEVDCGLLVDPQDPDAIAGAMKWILEHPQKAREMGEKGKRAVEEIYNWESESKKLIAMYEELLANKNVGKKVRPKQ
jgi:glycosyltransferase involved in cell wall biosynthesis